MGLSAYKCVSTSVGSGWFFKGRIIGMCLHYEEQHCKRGFQKYFRGENHSCCRVGIHSFALTRQLHFIPAKSLALLDWQMFTSWWVVHFSEA